MCYNWPRAAEQISRVEQEAHCVNWVSGAGARAQAEAEAEAETKVVRSVVEAKSRWPSKQPVRVM